MKKTDEPIVIEETFDAGLETVWLALTELDQMHQWYFDIIESFKPEVGFKTQFEVHNEGRTFTHLWTITDVLPKQKITYNWKYLEYPGNSFVTFELTEENAKVKLRLTTDVIEDFPSDIPEFRRESCIQGWTYFINGNLKQYIEAVMQAK